MAEGTLTQQLDFPCLHCNYLRRVSVESETATVILPTICPMRRACEREVLRAYYVTIGEAKC